MAQQIPHYLLLSVAKLIDYNLYDIMIDIFRVGRFLFSSKYKLFSTAVFLRLALFPNNVAI